MPLEPIITNMKLTEEQLLIVGSQSKSLAVIAFAGTGKTSTLCAYAQARKDKRFIYLAFNKKVKRTFLK